MKTRKHSHLPVLLATIAGACMALSAASFAAGGGGGGDGRDRVDYDNLNARLRGDLGASGEVQYSAIDDGSELVINSAISVDMPVNGVAIDETTAAEADVRVVFSGYEDGRPYAECLYEFDGFNPVGEIVSAHYTLKIRQIDDQIMTHAGIVCDIDYAEEGIQKGVPVIEAGDTAVGLINGIDALQGTFD